MGYYGFKIASWLARILPRRMALKLATLAGWALFVFKRDDRCGLISNIRHIAFWAGNPLSEREILRLARRVFPNFCKNLVDFFWMHRLGNDQAKQLAPMTDTALIEQLLRQGRGLILLAAHLGSWEVAGRVLVARGFKLNVVALPQPTQKLNELFQGQRRGGGMTVIPMGIAARACIAALRRGEIVAILCDRDFTAQRNLTTFFGKPARLPRGAARLALSTGAPLLLGACVRTPDDKFQIRFSAPIFPGAGPDEESRIQTEIAARLEGFIAKHPDQWFLFHDFWDIEKDLKITHGALKRATRNVPSPSGAENKS
jgi:KDO2-lipid IV(A) lauroyltransferase